MGWHSTLTSLRSTPTLGAVCSDADVALKLSYRRFFRSLKTSCQLNASGAKMEADVWMVCAFEQRRSAFTSSAAGSRQVKMETTTGNSAERLWADDENAKARILEIDLSAYDELITYPVEVDWPRERRKIIFLQTALRLAIPWNLIDRKSTRL